MKKQQSDRSVQIDHRLIRRAGEGVGHALADELEKNGLRLDRDLHEQMYRRFSCLHESLGERACVAYERGVKSILLRLDYDAAARQIANMCVELHQPSKADKPRAHARNKKATVKNR